MILASLKPGKSEAELNRWINVLETKGRQPRTPAPTTLLGAIQTILDGTSVYLTVNLEAGRTYHLSDDDSGIEASFAPK